MFQRLSVIAIISRYEVNCRIVYGVWFMLYGVWPTNESIHIMFNMIEWNRDYIVEAEEKEEEEFMSNKPQEHIMIFEPSCSISSIYLAENQI